MPSAYSNMSTLSRFSLLNFQASSFGIKLKEIGERPLCLISWKADINQPINIEGSIIKKDDSEEKNDKLHLNNIQKLSEDQNSQNQSQAVEVLLSNDLNRSISQNLSQELNIEKMPKYPKTSKPMSDNRYAEVLKYFNNTHYIPERLADPNIPNQKRKIFEWKRSINKNYKYIPTNVCELSQSSLFYNLKNSLKRIPYEEELNNIIKIFHNYLNQHLAVEETAKLIEENGFYWESIWNGTKIVISSYPVARLPMPRYLVHHQS
ncbi:unnamed protein product [Blepharisma stoltei]|uniref:Uncharacterized protein n=1 Tax=Blepharisma stoltei TaxID=1481888 RepID=A0AAU9JAF6_9CILI|nr:unnamed protein product [Blepharisma stoltei]